MTRKKIDVTEAEKKTFREAVRGVKPLTHTKVNTINPPAIKRKRIEPYEEECELALSDYEKLELLDGNDLIEFARSGISHKVLRKLRTGQYNVSAILDLHGQTAEEAKKSLSAFLSHCQQNDIRYIRIIHGKGRENQKPVLKNKLNHWLRQIDTVLAFCSATAHGRGGALHVLLKGR